MRHSPRRTSVISYEYDSEIAASLAAELATESSVVEREDQALQADWQATQSARSLGQATFDAVSAHICILDGVGKILVVNQAWRNFYDENTSEPGHKNYGIGTNYLNVCESSVGPRSTEAAVMAEGMRSVMAGTRTEFVMEYPCHSPTQQRWFNAKVTRFPGESGHVVVSHETITDIKLAQARLQLAASVFTNAREGILITDAEGRIVEVNDTFTRITGHLRDEVIGENPRLLSSGRQSGEFYHAMWSAVTNTGYWSGEAWNRRKDGREFAEQLTISAVPDADGQSLHYVGLFTDITDSKEHARQLEHVAHYDALTNLPNRMLLADRLHQAVILSERQKRAFAVVMLDLDGFMGVNDSHGHQAGDELLVVLAQHMKAALRSGDTLARTGGDEFVALLVDLEQARDCEPMLDRLAQAAATPVVFGDAVLQVSASMGVTLYPQDGSDADLLLRHADQAMYHAKAAGKNRFHLFDVAQDAAVKTQRESLERIRCALQGQEFLLYYQPKVNLRTHTVMGVEALIRWQHPERGLLAPAAFLPVVEGHALSVEIGEWVIAAALAQIAAWQAVGLELGVSVNIGARQLQQVDFAARLSDLLNAQPDVAPCLLELEVLETSALEDMGQVCEVMRACAALGVDFSLDDFGTGYSSLTYLKRLPVAMLKIDQSFVRGMLEDQDDQAIVKGVIGLASAFHRQVIAEGVETAEHGQLLLSLGCDLAQGFGIARPMPAGDLPDWVKTWTAPAAPKPKRR